MYLLQNPEQIIFNELHIWQIIILAFLNVGAKQQHAVLSL